MASKDKSKTAGFGAFPGGSGAGLELLGGYGTAMMDMVGKSGAEFVEFVSARLQEDMKIQQELMNCRDVSKLADIQSNYLKTAFEQYSDEAAKMMKRSSDLMDEVMKSGKS